MAEPQHSSHAGNFIKCLRVTLFILGGSALLGPSLYQPYLDYLWKALSNNILFRSATFEITYYVLCFVTSEAFYSAVYDRHPEWRLVSREKSAQPYRPQGMHSRIYRLYEVLIYMVSILVLNILVMKTLARSSSPETFLISKPVLLEFDQSTFSSHAGQFRRFIYSLAHRTPYGLERHLPAEHPNSRRLVLEFCGTILLYDAGFFLFHLAMHSLSPLKRLHAYHHSHAEIFPQITNQFEVFERSVLILLAILSPYVCRSHPLTMALWIPVHLYLLVENHCGMDVPWGYDKLLPDGWAMGSRKHARHHALGDGDFAPFFGWCDAIRNHWKPRLVKEAKNLSEAPVS